MTLEIDPVLASYRLRIDCFTVRQDGVMVADFYRCNPLRRTEIGMGQRQSDDATNKTHDSG